MPSTVEFGGTYVDLVPDAIPAEACYLGWQESLALLKMLVEARFPTRRRGNPL